MATVTQLEPEKDQIVLEYEASLEKISQIEGYLVFWEMTLAAEPMNEFLNRLLEEFARRKLDWINILPKDFALDQARVQALDRMVSELQEEPGRVRETLLNQRQIKTKLETEYPLILQAAGYLTDAAETEGAEEAPEKEKDFTLDFSDSAVKGKTKKAKA